VAIPPKVKKCKKMVQKRYILVHFCSKHVHFCKKSAKKCKNMLIFTLIFRPKTNKSYKITLFTIINHPIFQNFPQKPYISPYFPTFFLLSSSFSIYYLLSETYGNQFSFI